MPSTMPYFHRLTRVSLLSLILLLAGWLGCTCEPTPPGETPITDASPPDITTSDLAPERKAETTPEVSKEAAQEATPEATPEAQREPTSDATPTTTRPNLLLIIADDYGTDVSLAYHDDDGDGKADDGRTYATTPNINTICKQGVRFRQAWATPLCSSTRATILTGRYGFRTGIGEAIPRDGGLGIQAPTIPKLLDLHKILGFQHANIGKWHLGTNAALQGDKAPNVMGWSHYAGSLSGELADFSSWNKVTDGQASTATDYATSVNVNDAITWLGKQDKARPWLLWLAFNAPHNPLHLPPQALHTVPDLTGTAAHIRDNKPAYYRAMVQAMDTEIGRLITWLKAQKMYDNTLIVFLGDNGTQAGAVEAPYERTRSKGTLYQNGIHVPMCAIGPMVKNGGRTSDALVHSVDIYATLLEAAGVDVSKDLAPGFDYDSVSFLPLLKDPNATFPRAWNYAERFTTGEAGKGTQTIRDTTYKLLRTYDAAGNASDAFFDLKDDALETKDLLSSSGPLSAAQKTAYDALVKQLETLHNK